MKQKTQSVRCKMLLTCGVLVLASACFAQNLISNGNFEAFHSQPPHYQQITSSWNQNKFAQSWTTASEGSPDLFTDNGTYACGNPNSQTDNPGYVASPWTPLCYPQVCPLENTWGEQSPHSGDNYVGMGCYLNYEYIQTTFTPLAAGQCYQLQFWASLADRSENAVRLQAVISYGSIEDYTVSTGVLDPSMASYYNVLTSPNFVTNKTGWTLVTLDFIAQGGEDHLTIGLFDPNGIPDPSDPNSLLPTVMTAPNTGTCGDDTSNDPCGPCSDSDYPVLGYYYIDDVSLAATAGSFTPSANCTFSTSNPNISGSFVNKNILISGDVVLSGHTTFIGCTVKCNDGSSITVPFGLVFTINTSTISAGCANMWDGIIVAGRIQVEGSTIQDALCAINTQGSAASWSITRNSSPNTPNLFYKNKIDMIVSQYVLSTSNQIKGTTFDHTVPTNNAGWGTNCLIFNGNSSAVQEIIGGSSSGDACYFLGSATAIKSYYFPLAVMFCYFADQTDRAIDFQSDPAATSCRKLYVVSSTFMKARNHIFSAHKTDLTIYGSSFNYAQEHSVIWIDNREGELIVGDPSNSALGNTFQFSQWASIVAWGNKTAMNNLGTLAADTTHAYTEITIANNVFNNLTYAIGIIIAEWGLGTNPSYHSLDISLNQIKNTHQGIVLSNIMGWYQFSSFTPPTFSVHENYISISTATYAHSVGIKASNSSRLHIGQNLIVGFDWGNYINRGIACDNVDRSLIEENIIQAGTGVLAMGWMNQSDIYCNWLLNYADGFNLAGCYLRPSPSDPHGEIGLRTYNSLWNSGIPWNADITLWNSDVQYNKWMWDSPGGLTINYWGSTGTGSVISSYTASDPCEDFMFSPVTSVSQEIVDISITGDPVAQWRADYMYEIHRRGTGSGDSTVASSNIKKIINAEILINSRSYDDALTVLGTITPANDLEEHYVDVLTILATVNDESREPTTGEIEDLTEIAELEVLTDGPAVAVARTYLLMKYNLTFDDRRYLEEDEINGVAAVDAPCSMEDSTETWLSFIDSDGNDLEIQGTYVATDGSFTFDPLQTNYYADLNEEAEYRIFSTYGSKYTVVNYEYHTLAYWLSISPFNLDMAGVSLEIDTTDESSLADIPNYTSMEDGESNEYSVGYVEGSNGKDFLIEKRDRYDNLLWTRTWDGPVSGDDEATCMYLDAEANVYVAGKVYNGKNFDVQILKYDTDGNLVWTALFASEDEVDNNPTGIAVNEGDGSVEIAGEYGSGYRYIKVWQCLPGEERRTQTPTDSLGSSMVLEPAFYPSPSTGTVNVQLNGQSSGLFELLTLDGQLVYTQQILKSGEIQLPSGIANGVYLIKFTGEGEPYYQKLVIQRNNE